MNEFIKPTLEYFELAPLLVIFGAACFGVLIEAFVPRGLRYTAQVTLAGSAMVGALLLTVLAGRGLPEVADGKARGMIGAMGELALDGPTYFLWALILVLGLLGLMLFAERQLEGGVSGFSGLAAAVSGSDAERTASEKKLEHTEVFPLLLFAVLGMLIFPASNDLLTMFVALEILSLPLYLLSGLARRRRLLSQEAALKYFLLGAFSSAFFLFGAALLYGFSGSLQFAQISAAVQGDVKNTPLLLIGTGLVAVGLLFKVGAVPFQAWTPDVYQGAPIAVTAFMAAGTKVAAFGALLRLLYVALGADRASWTPMIAAIAVASMFGGALLALTQKDVKRILAYSSVAHTGFILTGLLGVRSSSEYGVGQLTSLQAVLFYLAAYGLTVLAAFALVGLVRDSAGETSQLDKWAGLGKESPIVAGIFAFLLLAMAGIPLTSGFMGKWAVFSVAWSAGHHLVVLAAVFASVIAAFLYLRIIMVMFGDDRDEQAPSVVYPSPLTATAIGFGAAATLALGVIPGPILDLAFRAGEFIR